MSRRIKTVSLALAVLMLLVGSLELRAQEGQQVLFGPQDVMPLFMRALSVGDLSVRRAASLLETTIEDLADLFRSYELTVPFDM